MFQKGFEAPAFDLDLLTYSVRAANVLVFTNHLCFRTFLRDVTIKLKHLQLSQRQIYISIIHYNHHYYDPRRRRNQSQGHHRHRRCHHRSFVVIVVIIVVVSTTITTTMQLKYASPDPC